MGIAECLESNIARSGWSSHDLTESQFKLTNRHLGERIMLAKGLILATDLPYILLKLRNLEGFAFALTALAIYFAVVLGKEKWQLYRTRSWPVAEAPVEAVRVERVDAGPNGVDYWKLHFEYTYQVKDKHTGKYSLNLVTNKLRDQAKAGIAGKTVRVHYDPKNESNSVLWEDEVWALW